MTEANPEWVEAVCAARFPAWDDMDPMTKKGARRQAEFWLEASEPLIRADERERYECPMPCCDDYDPVPNLVARGAVSDDHYHESCEADCCFAESVAARLVEVICEQESLIVWNIRWREQAEAEREHRRGKIHPISQCCLDAHVLASLPAKVKDIHSVAVEKLGDGQEFLIRRSDVLRVLRTGEVRVDG